jgi:hypothetical protein
MKDRLEVAFPASLTYTLDIKEDPMNRGLELVKAGGLTLKVNSPKRKMVTILKADGKRTTKLFESFEAMDEFVDAKVEALSK